jgi:hypothetical protein
MKRDDHHLIQRLLDGQLGPKEFHNLQQRLRQEPELLSLYQDYAALHHSLCEEYAEMPFRRMPHPRRSQWWIVLGSTAAAAAVLLLSFLILNNANPQGSPTPSTSLARVTFSHDASWEIEGQFHPLEEGIALMQGGTVRLTQGQAKWTLNSSATALIHGPSALTYEADDRLRLHHGSGRFRLDAPGRKLEVATPSMTAIDLGTEFALAVYENEPDELHVIEGKVQMMPLGKNDGPILLPGQAGRVTASQSIERFPADASRFARQLSEFQTISASPFRPGQWRVTHGQANIAGESLTGQDFMAFLELPEALPSPESPILLATLRVEEPLSGSFHTEGWSGMSFYAGEEELLFFGDSHGPETTWSIDGKQGQPVTLPPSPLSGPREITLRYDFNTGNVTLHEGSATLPAAFCHGQIPPGTRFDRIRLGASPEAALHVSAYHIRTGSSAH